MTAGPRVAALITYPIKGAAGVPVDRIELTPAGLAEDRAFMLVDPDGTFLSQRVLPRLAVLRPRVDGGKLALAGPGMPELTVPIDPDGPRRPVSLFGAWFGPAADQGDEAADWCSALLERPCRLVRVPPEHDRPGSGEASSPVGFADSTAVTVLSGSSVRELNRRIVERGGKPLPYTRFRPNILVTGWPEPHTEDRVVRMRVGAAEIGYAKPCIRCAVTLVDQETGATAGPEPLRTLATYRRHPTGGVALAMKAATLTPGPLTTGAPVEVTHWA